MLGIQKIKIRKSGATVNVCTVLMKTFFIVTFSYRIWYKFWGSCVLLPEWILDFEDGLFNLVNFLNLCLFSNFSSYLETLII